MAAQLNSVVEALEVKTLDRSWFIPRSEASVTLA